MSFVCIVKFRSIRTACLCFPLLVFTACAGSDLHIADESRSRFLDEMVSDISLREGGVAILPVLAPQGNKYVNPLATELGKELAKVLSGAKIVSWQESYRRLKEADLGAEQDSAISISKTTPIITQEALAQIVEELHATYGDGTPSTSENAFWAFKDVTFYYEDTDPEALQQSQLSRIPADEFLKRVPVDSYFLNTVGDVAGVRYVLQVDANYLHAKIDEAGAFADVLFGLLDILFFFLSDDDEEDTDTSGTIENSWAMFGAFCRLWDCSSERVVWAGFASTYSPDTHSGDLYSSDPFEHAQVAAQGFAALLAEPTQ